MSGWQRATALDVKAALQQGVVESTDVATQRRRLARCGQLAGRVVDVDRQLVEVVHEIAVAHTLRICNVATDQTPLPRLSHCASPTGVDLDSRTVLVLLAWMIAVKLACDPSRDAATRTFFCHFRTFFCRIWTLFCYPQTPSSIC